MDVFNSLSQQLTLSRFKQPPPQQPRKLWWGRCTVSCTCWKQDFGNDRHPPPHHGQMITGSMTNADTQPRSHIKKSTGGLMDCDTQFNFTAPSWNPENFKNFCSFLFQTDKWTNISTWRGLYIAWSKFALRWVSRYLCEERYFSLKISVFTFSIRNKTIILSSPSSPKNKHCVYIKNNLTSL